MKPVEEAVKSTAPFINSTFSSKHTVELFSGKKRTKNQPYYLFATEDNNTNKLGCAAFLWFGPIFNFC